LRYSPRSPAPVASEQLGRRAPFGIDASECLPVGVADDEVGVRRFGGPKVAVSATKEARRFRPDPRVPSRCRRRAVRVRPARTRWRGPAAHTDREAQVHPGETSRSSPRGHRLQRTLNGRRGDHLQDACALGCEGIVSKRLGSPYRSGRTDHWVKVKNRRRRRSRARPRSTGADNSWLPRSCCAGRPTPLHAARDHPTSA
jgi:hypothetical protein